MKDYTTKEDERKVFILNYEIHEGNIIINFANNKKYIVPHTEKNERIILEKMRNQVVDYSSKRKKELIKKRKQNKVDLIVYDIILGSGVILCSLFGATIQPFLGGLGVCFFAFKFAHNTFLCVTSSIQIKKELTDIDKNILFLENEEKIRKGLEKVNVLINCDAKTSNIIEQKEININTVDGFSYNGLREIVNNIDLEENFEFEQLPLENKPKTRKRKK